MNCTACKVRGFTLNVHGKQVLNFKTIAVVILQGESHPKPLASFPTTFNLMELKKGFFPFISGGTTEMARRTSQTER